MKAPTDHPAIPDSKVAVLLINLGTPDSPEPASVRRYLGQFLSDRRVVEIPPILWQPILRGIILTTRPRKSSYAYKQVWTEEGSPLAAITARQAQRLQEKLGKDVLVDWAMRYGNPAIDHAIDRLMAAGATRIQPISLRLP
nr:putative ferrochelatase [uncultured bacterium]